MNIPTRKDWQALKKRHGVADKAAKGLSLGGALDKFWKAGPQPQRRVPALMALHAAALRYGSTLDKKRVKQYPQFAASYKAQVLRPITAELTEHKARLKAGARYKQALAKFFARYDELARRPIGDLSDSETNRLIPHTPGYQQQVVPSTRRGREPAPSVNWRHLREQFKGRLTAGLVYPRQALKDFGPSAPEGVAEVNAALLRLEKALRDLPTHPTGEQFHAFLKLFHDVGLEVRSRANAIYYVNPGG